MRALWSLAIVCLVAATGVRPANTSDRRATPLLRAAPPTARALVTPPAQQAVTRRTPASSLQLPPVTLVASFALRSPPARAITQGSLPPDRVFVGLVMTCSARGPPMA
jgi:hypothetical protein